MSKAIKETSKTIKETMLERVQDVRQGMNSLRSSDYGDVFFWQEVGSFADKELKAAWTKVQVEKKLVDEDDDLRDLGQGDHAVARSKLFVVTAKVSEPRKTFDTELFVARMSKRFKIVPEKLVHLMEQCKIDGKATLTKRVVENM